MFCWYIPQLVFGVADEIWKLRCLKRPRFFWLFFSFHLRVVIQICSRHRIRWLNLSCLVSVLCDLLIKFLTLLYQLVNLGNVAVGVSGQVISSFCGFTSVLRKIVIKIIIIFQKNIFYRKLFWLCGFQPRLLKEGVVWVEGEKHVKHPFGIGRLAFNDLCSRLQRLVKIRTLSRFEWDHGRVKFFRNNFFSWWANART